MQIKTLWWKAKYNNDTYCYSYFNYILQISLVFVYHQHLNNIVQSNPIIMSYIPCYQMPTSGVYSTSKIFRPRTQNKLVIHIHQQIH